MSQGQSPCRLVTFTRSDSDPIGVFTIMEADNVIGIAIQVFLGPVVFQGSGVFPNTAGGVPIPSQQIRMQTGGTFVWDTGGSQSPIDNFYVDCTEGGANIVLKM